MFYVKGNRNPLITRLLRTRSAISTGCPNVTYPIPEERLLLPPLGFKIVALGVASDLVEQGMVSARERERLTQADSAVAELCPAKHSRRSASQATRYDGATFSCPIFARVTIKPLR